MSTHAGIKALRQGLGALYAGTMAYCIVVVFYEGEGAMVIALAATALGAVATRYRVFREMFRVLAVLQAAGAILSYRIYFRSLDDSEIWLGVLGYVLLGIGLPMTVAAFVCTEPRTSFVSNLPVGYEHVERHYKPVSAWTKAFLILGVCLGMVLQMLSGAMFLMIIILPVGFAVYWLISMVRSRKGPTPTAARRLALRPRMDKPSQTRSHWTVNSSEFDDPEKYRQ